MRLSYTPPPGWDFATVGDLAKPEKGSIRIGPFGSALKKHEYSENGIRVLGIEDVHPNQFLSDRCKYIPDAKFCELRQYEVSDGDVLVTNMGTVGRACAVPAGTQRSIISSHLIKVSLNRSRADPAYLCWMLNYSPLVVAQIRAKSHGAIMAGFNSSLLKSLRIPLPPLAEQKQIAGILDAADALRVKRREALAQLDTLLQSTFLDMFGDPVTNPMGWEVVSVGDEIGFLTSGSRGWAKYYAKDGDTFIRIQNLKDGQLDLGDIAFVNAPESAEAKRTTVEPGDVLLSITADLGRTAVVPGGIAKAHINQHLAILRFTSLNPVFVSHQLASKGGQAQFDRLNREGVKAGLNFNDVKSIRLTNPPLDLQHRFAAIVESIEHQKASQRTHLAELDWP